MVRAFHVFYYNSKIEICHDSFTVFYGFHQPDWSIIYLEWWYNQRSWTIPSLWEPFHVLVNSYFSVICAYYNEKVLFERKKNWQNIEANICLSRDPLWFWIQFLPLQVVLLFDLGVFPTCEMQCSLTVDIGWLLTHQEPVSGSFRTPQCLHVT